MYSCAPTAGQSAQSQLIGGGFPMPLARILTHHPERATALSEQLQQQGYRVEVCRPDQPNLSGADLEIEFEICERSDALERAASLADELHADVAVAPGVLQAEAKPAIKEVAAPPAQEDVTDREREFEAAFQTAGQGAEPNIEPIAAQADLSAQEQPQVIDFPVMEQAPLHPITDRKSTRLNSSHIPLSRMPSS